MLILVFVILIITVISLGFLINAIRKKNKRQIIISALIALPVLFFATKYLNETVFTAKTERSGVVIDQETGEPLAGVRIEYYRAFTDDKLALNPKVVTDKNGYFHIRQKINENTLFSLDLEGYYSYVSELSKQGDTIKLEKLKSATE